MSNVAHSYTEASSPSDEIITLTEATFSAYDVELLDDVASRILSLAGIDAITGQRGVTVLRSGISMIAIPDTALPADLSTKDFRARLSSWKTL